jgi:hypothetical protein
MGFCHLGCSDPETIFLTDGASKGVQQVLNALIRNEKDGVIQLTFLSFGFLDMPVSLCMALVCCHSFGVIDI